MNIVLILYGLGYIASLVLVQNAHVPYTYFKANNNGVLYNQRYVSLYWYALFFCCMRLFVFLVVLSMLLYRKTLCCGRYAGCTVFWMAILVVLIMTELFALAIMGSYLGRCNGLGEVDNPCNDDKWCCAPEIFGDAANLCDNTAACTPAVSLAEMRANVDFLWLFAVTVVFVAGDIFFLLLPLGLWMTATHTILQKIQQDQQLPSSPMERQMVVQRKTPLLFNRGGGGGGEKLKSDA